MPRQRGPRPRGRGRALLVAVSVLFSLFHGSLSHSTRQTYRQYESGHRPLAVHDAAANAGDGALHNVALDQMIDTDAPTPTPTLPPDATDPIGGEEPSTGDTAQAPLEENCAGVSGPCAFDDSTQTFTTRHLEYPDMELYFVLVAERADESQALCQRDGLGNVISIHSEAQERAIRELADRLFDDPNNSGITDSGYRIGFRTTTDDVTIWEDGTPFNTSLPTWGSAAYPNKGTYGAFNFATDLWWDHAAGRLLPYICAEFVINLTAEPEQTHMPTPTSTPMPTPMPTSTPMPTPMPTSTSVPTPVPTSEMNVTVAVGPTKPAQTSSVGEGAAEASSLAGPIAGATVGFVLLCGVLVAAFIYRSKFQTTRWYAWACWQWRPHARGNGNGNGVAPRAAAADQESQHSASRWGDTENPEEDIGSENSVSMGKDDDDVPNCDEAQRKKAAPNADLSRKLLQSAKQRNETAVNSNPNESRFRSTSCGSNSSICPGSTGQEHSTSSHCRTTSQQQRRHVLSLGMPPDVGMSANPEEQSVSGRSSFSMLSGDKATPKAEPEPGSESEATTPVSGIHGANSRPERLASSVQRRNLLREVVVDEDGDNENADASSSSSPSVAKMQVVVSMEVGEDGHEWFDVTDERLGDLSDFDCDEFSDEDEEEVYNDEGSTSEDEDEDGSSRSSSEPAIVIEGGAKAGAPSSPGGGGDEDGDAPPQQLPKKKKRTKRKRPKVPATCQKCGVHFQSKPNLITHMKEIHGKVKGHPCDVCHKVFTRKFNLQVHKRTHLSYREKPWHCKACGESFVQKSNYKRHMLQRHEKPGKCPWCSLRFGTEEEILAHAQVKHNMQRDVAIRRLRLRQSNLKCYCGKRYDTLCDLNDHQEVCEVAKGAAANGGGEPHSDSDAGGEPGSPLHGSNGARRSHSANSNSSGSMQLVNMSGRHNDSSRESSKSDSRNSQKIEEIGVEMPPAPSSPSGDSAVDLTSPGVPAFGSSTSFGSYPSQNLSSNSMYSYQHSTSSSVQHSQTMPRLHHASHSAPTQGAAAVPAAGTMGIEASHEGSQSAQAGHNHAHGPWGGSGAVRGGAVNIRNRMDTSTSMSLARSMSPVHQRFDDDAERRSTSSLTSPSPRRGVAHMLPQQQQQQQSESNLMANNGDGVAGSYMEGQISHTMSRSDAAQRGDSRDSSRMLSDHEQRDSRQSSSSPPANSHNSHHHLDLEGAAAAAVSSVAVSPQCGDRASPSASPELPLASQLLSSSSAAAAVHAGGTMPRMIARAYGRTGAGALDQSEHALPDASSAATRHLSGRIGERAISPSTSSSSSVKQQNQNPWSAHTSPQFSSSVHGTQLFPVVDPMDPMLLERIRGGGAAARHARDTRRESNMSTSTTHSAISAMSTASSSQSQRSSAYQASGHSGSTPRSPPGGGGGNESSRPPPHPSYGQNVPMPSSHGAVPPTSVVIYASPAESEQLKASAASTDVNGGGGSVLNINALHDTQSLQPGSTPGVHPSTSTHILSEQASFSAKVSSLLQTKQLQNDEEEALARLLLQNKLKEQQLLEYKKALEHEEQMAVRQFLQQRTLARERAFAQKKLELERQFIDQQRNDENSQLLHLLLQLEQQRGRRQSVAATADSASQPSTTRLEDLFPTRAMSYPHVAAQQQEHAAQLADPTIAEFTPPRQNLATTAPLSSPHKFTPAYLTSPPSHLNMNVELQQQPVSGSTPTPEQKHLPRPHFSFMSPAAPPAATTAATFPSTAAAVVASRSSTAIPLPSQASHHHQQQQQQQKHLPQMSSVAMHTQQQQAASFSSLSGDLGALPPSESSSSPELKLFDHHASVVRKEQAPISGIAIPPHVSVPVDEWLSQAAQERKFMPRLQPGMGSLSAADVSMAPGVSSNEGVSLSSGLVSLGLNPASEASPNQLPGTNFQQFASEGSSVQHATRRDSAAALAASAAATAAMITQQPPMPQFAIPVVTPRATTHAVADPESASKRSSMSGGDFAGRTRAGSYSNSFSHSHSRLKDRGDPMMFSLDSLGGGGRSGSHSDLGRFFDSPSATGSSGSGRPSGGGGSGDSMAVPSNLSLFDDANFGTLGAMGGNATSVLSNAEHDPLALMSLDIEDAA